MVIDTDFDDDQQRRDNLNKYQELLRRAIDLIRQVEGWETDFVALRGNVGVINQGKMDNKKTQLINQLRAKLGIA
jgi:hypothetical protein